MTVGVWDVTSDVGVATFLCMIVDRREHGVRLLYPTAGMGCHPCREIALSRALTEAAQSRLTVIAGSRDDVTRAEYARYRNRDALSHVRARLASGSAERSFDCVPTFVYEHVGEDVAHLLRLLGDAGIEEVVAIDLTRPEFNVPVVRVVVPGLEGVSSLRNYVPGPRARATVAAYA